MHKYIHRLQTDRQTQTDAYIHSLHARTHSLLRIQACCIVQLDTFFLKAGSADVERGFYSHNGKQTQLLLIKQMWPRAIPCHTPWDMLRLAFRHIIGSISVKERPRSRESTVSIFCQGSFFNHSVKKTHNRSECMLTGFWGLVSMQFILAFWK